jgi:hypothetical protein
MTPESPLETQIGLWRDYVRRHQTIHAPDAEELEDHLRAEIATLTGAGLDAEEAFLVGVKRIGRLDALSQEFAREHSERLWKQLVGPGTTPIDPREFREVSLVITFGALAALALKLPELFGLHLGAEEAGPFYARNLSLFVLPFLTGYLGWKRRSGRAGLLPIIFSFGGALLLANLYPFDADGHTLRLAAIHLPIALWMAVGIAYVAGRWGEVARRMDFVRFSGELFIYYALIALGGGVLAGFTGVMFHAIGVDVRDFIGKWLLPCGAAGAVLVGAWLVEAKQSVIENMAPVLTRLFTPLFTAVLLVFLTTLLWTGRGIDVERNVLIGFDLLLVVVVGLVLYAISARDPQAPAGLFDALQLVLVITALLVDGFALAAIAARISAFGFSPNKVAALGENVVLLVSLLGSGWLYARFLRGRGSFATLERWQTAYLPVYFVWAWCVFVAFPPLFGFR